MKQLMQRLKISGDNSSSSRSSRKNGDTELYSGRSTAITVTVRSIAGHLWSNICDSREAPKHFMWPNHACVLIAYSQQFKLRGCEAREPCI